MVTFFSNIPKRKALTLVLFLVLFLSSGIFLARNFFKADETGAFILSGKIFAQDSKVALPDVNIILSTTDSGVPPVTAKSNPDGSYSVFAPANTFASISFAKDGYWDMEGSVVNSGNLSVMTLNLAMKPGFGREDIEIATIKQGKSWEKGRFGLSIDPFDDSPSGVKTIVPDGNTYKESLITSITGYDLEKHNFMPQTTYPTQANTIGKLPFVASSESTAAYSPDTDKYYLFGGPNPGDNHIYEYDRNSPNDLNQITDLPFAGPSLASIYVPEIKAILIFPRAGYISAYQPQTNKLIRVSQFIDFNYTRLNVFRGQDTLYLLKENDLSARSATQSELNILNVADLKVNFDSPCDANSCQANLQDTGIKIPRVGTIPYYYNQNSIYFLGGNENGVIQDTIIQVDPKDATKTTVLDQNHKMSTPLAYAAYQRDEGGKRMYLFGGVIDANNTPYKKTLTFYADGTGLPRAGEEDFKPTFSDPIIDAPFVQDNSNRTLIFNQNVQKISGSLTLFAGETIEVGASSDKTILFRGKAKTDAFSFTNKTIQETNWQNYGPTYFANPYGEEVPLSGIQLKHQDKIFNLKEAVDNGIIAPNVHISNYPTQKILDLSNLDQIVMPGDYFAFWAMKNGLQVGFGLSSVKGTVTDANNNPISGVTINAFTTYGELIDLQTDASGNFQIEKVDSISSMSVEKPGYNDKSLIITNPVNTSDLSFGLTLNPGDTSEFVQLIALKKDQKTNFGVSIKPKDDQSVKIITQNNQTYNTSVLSDNIQAYDYDTLTMADLPQNEQLQSGQIYSITPSRDYVLQVSGESEGELSSMDLFGAANPYLITSNSINPIPLDQYQVNYQDSFYNLKEAAAKNIIKSNIGIDSTLINLSAIDTNALSDYSVFPGNILELTANQDIILNEEPEYDPDYANGYMAIPNISTGLQSAGVGEEEIYNILKQMMACTPSYFERNTNQEQRDSCLDSLQFSDENNNPVTVNTPAKGNLFIDTAKAAVSGDIKKGIIRKATLPQLEALRETEFFVDRVNYMRKNYGKSRVKIARWDWPKYFYEANSEENRYKFERDDQKSEAYWKYIPKNPMFRKKYWNDEKLDSLYMWYWPDLAENRYKPDFTPEERKRLMTYWNAGLSKVVNKLPNLPNPGDIGITGPSPWDDVFFLMPFSKYFAGAAKSCSLELGKMFCSMKTKPITEVMGRTIGENVVVHTGGNLTKSVSKKVVVRKIMTPKLIHEFNLPGQGITTFGHELNFDTLVNAKGTTFLSRKHLDRMIDDLVDIGQKYTEHPFFQEKIADIGVNNAKYHLYHDLKGARIISPLESVKKHKFGVLKNKVAGEARLPHVEFDQIIAWKSLSEYKTTALHELMHNQVKNGYTYSNKYYIQRGLGGFLPIEEGLTDYLSRIAIQDLYGMPIKGWSYPKEVSLIAKPMKQALMRINGYSEKEAEQVLARILFKDGIEDGINKAFDQAARRTIYNGKPLLGPNDHFHDVVYNTLKQGEKTGNGYGQLMNKLDSIK